MGEDQSNDLELDGPITLRILDSEMMEVMEDREVWRLNLELLPPQPSRKSGQWRKKKKKKILSWAKFYLPLTLTLKYAHNY